MAELTCTRYAASVPEKQRATFICLLLALVTLAVYWPAAHFDFINYDDPDYVIYNSPIQHGLNSATVAWAFTTDHASNWHPLTWISHAADFALYGLNPGGHHLTSLLIHTLNSVLLFLILWQLTRSQWRSAVVAALFAWHPLHVESVAWISERKDVLSTFFLLLTLSAYGKYASLNAAQLTAQSPPASKSKLYYWLALFLFVLALLAKPMVVTLPFVLLLLDFWPLNRFNRLGKVILEKIPFLVLSAADCFATFWAQKNANSVVSSFTLPVPDRLANALVSYVLYLWKTIWPLHLALPYPYSHEWTFAPAIGAALLLLLISVAALLMARNRPFLIVGWLWFLGMLVPVIGLVQVGIQFMADRYSYVPLIGIFIMAVWMIPTAWTHWPRPGFIFAAVVTAVLLFLLSATETQLQYWHNSITLFSHTIAETSNNILAEYNLAEALARHGDNADAILHYQAALALHPNRVEAQYNSQNQAHYNLGVLYRLQKQWPEAETQFRAFVHDDPTTPNGHVNLGISLVALGRVDEAISEFRATIKPREPLGADIELQILTRLESAYLESGKISEAIVTAQKIHDTALVAGKPELAAAAAKRLDTYKLNLKTQP